MEILVEHKIRSRLQEWLEERQWNYTDAAGMTGVDIGTIKRYAKNHFDRVDCSSWQAICDGFEKPLGELFYKEKAD